MKVSLRKSMAFVLCASILLPSAGAGTPRQARSSQPMPPPSLREYLQKSYLELFELAPTLEFSPAEIEAQRNALKSGKDLCVDRFANHAKRYGKQIDAARSSLKRTTAKLTGPERKQVHCNIQNL